MIKKCREINRRPISLVTGTISVETTISKAPIRYRYCRYRRYIAIFSMYRPTSNCSRITRWADNAKYTDVVTQMAVNHCLEGAWRLFRCVDLTFFYCCLHNRNIMWLFLCMNFIFVYVVCKVCVSNRLVRKEVCVMYVIFGRRIPKPIRVRSVARIRRLCEKLDSGFCLGGGYAIGAVCLSVCQSFCLWAG